MPVPRELVRISYEAAAQAYLRSLPLEHFMEATAQGKQREITLESLALVRAVRSDVHVFNELLVQYRLKGNKKIHQVVPDNMVVLHEGPLEAETSYNIELEPARPFWMLEYVSKRNRRKDYEDNLVKYEKDIKVPYYLTFYPDNEELTLYVRRRARYVSVKPNENDRLAIPELDLEVALLGGWVRYWHKGALLPLPADLMRQVSDLRTQLQAAQQQAEAAQQQAEAAKERADHVEAENRRLREEIERLRRA